MARSPGTCTNSTKSFDSNIEVVNRKKCWESNAWALLKIVANKFVCSYNSDYRMHAGVDAGVDGIMAQPHVTDIDSSLSRLLP